MRRWTKQSAEEYIKKAKEKGLTYWSAMDYLKHHKTMHAIIQEECMNIFRAYVKWICRHCKNRYICKEELHKKIDNSMRCDVYERED